ncbi:hypothetical protein [Pedobacter gandavensis]|uniref:hypothetical protein n=1 Tax=Pedobacter gandavensis TaxID=2679963 RepID=UPI00292CE2DD|nr:hypothetical protein [Pedobacter gandavensis]
MASCVDWYLVTRVIATGEMVNSVYLYSECTGGSGGGGGGGGGEGGSTISYLTRELNTEAVKQKFPCVDKLILQVIFGLKEMTIFVLPFISELRPTITYTTGNLQWGSPTTGGTFMLGNATYDPQSRAQLSSVVTLNEQMLKESSPLLIAGAAVHETMHGYLNYKITLATNEMEESFKYSDNWLLKLSAYHDRTSGSNTTQHTNILINYFDDGLKVLGAWNKIYGGNYDEKDMAMAMIYGLDHADTHSPQTLVDKINEAYSKIKIKYNISDQDLNTFKNNNLFSNNKMATTGCN